MKEYLMSFGIFTISEVNDFLALGREKLFHPNDFLIREGAISQEFGFIISGQFRSFYYSNTGEEVTYCITFSNNLISAYSSYISGQETPENIQAISPARVLLFSKYDIEALFNSNPKWLLFSKYIAEQEYIAMEKRVFTLQKDKAETRYKNLLKEEPELLQKVPLKYIASYLGITQRHLSRLRKEVSN